MRRWTDPEIGRVRELLALNRPQPGAPPATYAERRARMDQTGAMGGLPKGTAVEDTVLGGVAAERITPSDAAAGRAMLYLHGGAYVAGSPRSHRPMVAWLAKAAGASATAIDYRLGPEHPFPAAVEDAVAAYRALLSLGADPARTVIAGDSAGGGLTLATALALKAEGLPQPAGLFVISPWADLTQSAETYELIADRDPMITKAGLDESAAAYLGGADPRDPLASPVFGDLKGLAPLLIQVGSDETLLGDSLKLTERAGLAQVEVRLEVWPEMVHVWHAFSGQLLAARRALTAAGAWIADRAGG